MHMRPHVERYVQAGLSVAPEERAAQVLRVTWADWQGKTPAQDAADPQRQRRSQPARGGGDSPALARSAWNEGPPRSPQH